MTVAAPAAGVPVLELRGVSVRLSAFLVLRRVSLTVPVGTIVGLVGRNGAGKTTTLKSVAGLVPVLSGEIRLAGEDLRHYPPHARPRLGIGYLPEDRRLIGPLTVEENLLLPVWAGACGTGERARVQAVYERLPEVAALARRRAAALSGGQQKLVAPARALVTGTRLLLLDEPFEGLSPVLTRRLAEVIRTLAGVAVLVTESGTSHMARFADRVYTIERGEIVGDLP